MAHMEQHTKRSPHKKVGIKCRFIEWLTRVESWLGQVKTHPFSELIRETVQQTQSKRYKPETLHVSQTEGRIAVLHCGRLTKGKVTWTRDTNGQRVDILTTHNGEMTKHIADPDRRYGSGANLVLTIFRVSQSDAGRYDCSGATVELSVTSGTGYAVKHNQEHVYDSIDDTMPTAQPVSDQQRTEEPIYYLASHPGAQTTETARYKIKHTQADKHFSDLISPTYLFRPLR
ncbi:hypothetical protein SRHO_G00100380 [Serrasalmus rhombeus]